MVASSFNRLPARLVREDGKVIELIVQEYDIAVERTHSAFGIPLSDGLKFGIDVNQPNVVIEMTGIITDDTGSITSALGVGSEGTINFDFSRTITRNGVSQSLPYLPATFTSSPSNTGSIIYDELHLQGKQLMIPFAEWEGDTVNGVMITFDGIRKGTKQEPYFYLNKERVMTGITVNGTVSVSAGSNSLNIPTNGDSREWLEIVGLTTSIEQYRVKVGTGGTIISGRVTSTGSGSFQLYTDAGTSAMTMPDNSIIKLLKNDNFSEHIDSQTGFPNIVISVGDIINPDTTYPDTSNKPQRRNPADEIVYRLFKALSSTVSLGTKVSNVDDASTNIGKSSNYSSNLGALYVHRQGTHIISTPSGNKSIKGKVKLLQRKKGSISPGLIPLHNWLVSWSPLIAHFSGGIDPITGTKSAGDKAQDLIGILSNSNNFTSTLRTEIMNSINALGLGSVLTNIHGPTQKGDYINGLQLPYDSITTVGETENRVLELVDAVPTGSGTTEITTGATHELSVGTQISISNFYQGPSSTMAVDLTGDHTVASISNEFVFIISTNSSSNAGSFSGDISYDLTKGNMGRKQRNFFVSNGNPGMEQKMSISNNVPASNPFNSNGTASRAAGIKGLVEAFEIEYNAAQKVYDFVVKFRVAKSIL